MGDKLALAAALGILGLGALAEEPAKPVTSAPKMPEVRVWAPPIPPEPPPLFAGPTATVIVVMEPVQVRPSARHRR